MQTLKKYYFGKSKSKPNTFIGGVGDVITNASQVASLIGLGANRVRGFVKKGNNIEFEVVGGTYSMQYIFISEPNITYFIDKDGLVTSFGQGFGTCLNLKKLEFPKCTYIYGGNGGGWMFSVCPKLTHVYLPLCVNFGQTAGEDQVFRSGYPLNARFYVPASLQSVNSGSPDGDLITGIGNGITARYINNLNKPNSITNLSAGTVYNTAIQLNFTPSTGSTNAIDFYEVYLNNSLIPQVEIKNSGEFITGLNSSTNYNITVVAVDIFYNKSEVSNVLNVTTSNNLTDSDANNYITASANTAFQYPINDFFKMTKDFGLYNKIQAFYPFLGTTAAQHKWNAKNPLDTNAAFRLLFSGGGTHNNLGYQCNGTNAYANTFFAPSSVQDVNSNGLTVVVGTNNDTIQTDVVEVGSQNSATQGSYVICKNKNTDFLRATKMNATLITQLNVNDAKGIFTGVKQNATVSKLFRSSIQIASGGSGGTLPTQNIFIGNININGTPYSIGWSNQRIQFVAIHEGLTDTEVQTLHTIIDTFEAAIGRKTW